MRRAVIGQRMEEHLTPDGTLPVHKSHTQMEHGSENGSSSCTLRRTNDRLVGVTLYHAQEGGVKLAADGGLEVIFSAVEQRPVQGETEGARGGEGSAAHQSFETTWRREVGVRTGCCRMNALQYKWNTTCRQSV